MDPTMITPDTPAMKSPEGVEPNFINPPSHDKANVILHTICLTLTTLFLMMRLYTRHYISHWVGWDDYACILSYALTVTFSGLLLHAQELGLGRHIWDTRAIDLPHVLKALFIAEILYIPLVSVVKSSFLMFFERIFFPSQKMKYCCRLGLLGIWMFYIALFFRSIFLCDPLEKVYNPAVPGHCLQKNVTPYLSGVFNTISDLYILLLPVPFIWNLNMKVSRKLRLIAVFSAGIFACAASVVRLAMTFITIENPDVTWEFATLSLWTVLEIDVGIICACSLALPAFLDRHWPRRGSSRLLSKIESYFGSFSKSGSNKPSSEHMHSSSKMTHDTPSSEERLQVPHPSEHGWTRLDPKGSDPKFLAPLMGPPNTTHTSVGRAMPDEDLENWGQSGILKKVEFTQSYPLVER